MGISCFSVSERKFSENLEKYTDERLKGSMILIKENNNFLYIRRESLNFSSVKLIQIIEKFYLEKEDLLQLWNFYKKINKDNTGFIRIDDLYLLLKENQSNTIIAPYSDRFFVILDKKFIAKVTFEELISNLISFCMYSIFQIIKFVFEFLDKNNRGYVTRTEITKLVDTNRDDQPIYLKNHSFAISQIADFRRSDKINLEDFVDLCNKMPFVYFPAIHFQNSLRKYYINNKFWEKFTRKTIEKHKKTVKDKAEIKIKEKIQGYKKKIEKKSDDLEKSHRTLFMQNLRLNRKNSDTNFFLIYKYNKSDTKKRVTSSSNIRLFCH